MPNTFRTAANALFLSVSAAAVTLPATAVAQTLSADPQFAQFAPSNELAAGRIDYSIWSEAMRSVVVPMGPSLRETPGT
ncbi:MAG: DUF547 domain-containing protein, partial [Pseudomonadota bacterium]